MNKYQNCGLYSSQSQSQVKEIDTDKSFFTVLEAVKEMVEFNFFEKADRETVSEICMIITEIFKLQGNYLVTIDGHDIQIADVQDVFRLLRHEHIEMVLENFKRVSYKVNHIKTYIRTALYNSVMEINQHYTNCVNSDICIPRKPVNRARRNV